MKILYLAMDPTIFNKENRSHEVYVAEYLAKSGNEVIMCRTSKPNYKDNEKLEHLTVEVMPLNEGLTYEEIEKVCSYDYDIVFVTSISGLAHAKYFAKRKNVKCVVQVLDVPVWRLQSLPGYEKWIREWDQWIKALVEDVDLIIANTNITKKVLWQLSNGRLWDKTKVIYYGISIDEIEKSQSTEKKNQIIWVSNIKFHKGLDLLIYSLAQVKDAPPLVIIGQGDGNETCINFNGSPIPLRYLDTAHQVGVNMSFIGSVDDTIKFNMIKESSLAVYCDFSYTISSMFPLEASYCGIPCIVGNMELNKERFGDTVIFLEERFNTGEWASKIKEILSNREEFIKNTEQNKKWIKENRSCESHAKGLLESFQEVIKNDV